MHGSYTVSCLQLIISFYSYRVFKYSAWLRCYQSTLRLGDWAESIAYKNRYVWETKKKWKNYKVYNKLNKLLTGSTLSLGYIHRKTQHKRGVISTEEIIFGYLRQPHRQAISYDTFPSYDRVTSVSLSLTAVRKVTTINGRTEMDWERNGNSTFCDLLVQ